MRTITQAQFKDLMRTHGTVSNVQVDEPISYWMADLGNTPPNMTITNCRLVGFVISKNQIESLTFNKGRVGKLQIETESGIQNLTVNKTNIKSMELVETNVGQLALSPGRQEKLALTGRMATVNEMTIVGDMKMIQINSFDSNSLSVTKCKLASFDLNNARVKNVSLKNVTSRSPIVLNFESSKPDSISVLNVNSNFYTRFEYVKEITLGKPIKNFNFTLLPSS